ncbi:uncharacterized protein B0H18DRAFT_536568 [Fomitopsis serialis]|uniref:uncharacterized protein n=1 Tax=Fomitopsis serialis TaxID=139415 RepID=UPI002007D0D8|nr:uncharacterized protein B0H18DRAFT_536568 [Neoantrodia serialis]KAH9921751.1 hypothetical protein B0H18DRAFT_536568 [Neoantrodia serialis]
MRLRYLDVNLNDERMAMFSDWMMHSGLCTSLADLTVSPEVASMAQIPLNKLLETAGTSLVSFRLSNGFNYGRSVHGSVLQNTALRSWSFELQLIERVAKDQGPRAVWTKAMNELHGIFSTVRSRHLEYIKVKVRVPVGDSILEPEKLGVVLEGLDLRGLHEVVSQPYFDALQDVEVKIVLAPLTRHWQTRLHVDGIDLDSIGQQLQTMFHGILQPWVARGIVAITWL